MRLDLGPEDRLCLLLARGRLSTEDEGQAREIMAAPLRWDLVLERARIHDIVPLTYHHLRSDSGKPGSLGGSRAPQAVESALEEAYRINQLRSKLLAEELARLLRWLGQNQVPVIPLKGVTLAAALYGDAALRVSLDIDLLVPEGEAVRARRLLLSHGFESNVPEAFFLGYQFPQCADSSLLPARQGAGFPLDLRWRLRPYTPGDAGAIRDLWAESSVTEYFGERARALSPEWEFLYLAIHAASHGWQMLKSLIDIHRMAASSSVDWPKARQKAGRFGLDGVVERTLGACSLLLGTLPPAGFAARPLPSGVRLFPATPAPAGSWSAARFELYALDRRRDRLRTLAAFVFSPSPAECGLVALPAWLGFLYFVLRPLRLAVKWTRAGVARSSAPPSPSSPP